jgi:hypothetical protein
MLNFNRETTGADLKEKQFSLLSYGVETGRKVNFKQLRTLCKTGIAHHDIAIPTIKTLYFSN